LSEEILVSIKVSRIKDKIDYTVDCSKDVTSEELAHYLNEIIDGICTWKPEVCKQSNFTGTIK
jgi:hypothetical protein